MSTVAISRLATVAVQLHIDETSYNLVETGPTCEAFFAAHVGKAITGVVVEHAGTADPEVLHLIDIRVTIDGIQRHSGVEVASIHDGRFVAGLGKSVATTVLKHGNERLAIALLEAILSEGLANES